MSLTIPGGRAESNGSSTRSGAKARSSEFFSVSVSVPPMSDVLSTAFDLSTIGRYVSVWGGAVSCKRLSSSFSSELLYCLDDEFKDLFLGEEIDPVSCKRN